jgi:hypothetical protein
MKPQLTRRVLNAIQLVCLTAALSTLVLNNALTQQRLDDQRRLSVIETLVDTERDVGRMPHVTHSTIRDHLRPLKHPTLYGHWFLRNLVLISTGLLSTCSLACLGGLFFGNKPPSGSSLKTEN